jgi:hypothetical protein
MPSTQNAWTTWPRNPGLNYPGPEGNEEDAWFQSWFLAQIQALEKADVVVALGGKVSQTASTLLHLAEARGLPIIPFAFLGGGRSAHTSAEIGRDLIQVLTQAFCATSMVLNIRLR